jgi:hypothetical protein
MISGVREGGRGGRDAGRGTAVCGSRHNRTGGRGLEEGRRAKGRTAGGRGGGEVGRRGIRLPSNGGGADLRGRASPVGGASAGRGSGLVGASQATSRVLLCEDVG